MEMFVDLAEFICCDHKIVLQIKNNNMQELVRTGKNS